MGSRLDTVEIVVKEEDAVQAHCHHSHPLHPTFMAQRSTLCMILLLPLCRKERFHRFFLPAAIRLYNSAHNFSTWVGTLIFLQYFLEDKHHTIRILLSPMLHNDIFAHCYNLHTSVSSYILSNLAHNLFFRAYTLKVFFFFCIFALWFILNLFKYSSAAILSFVLYSLFPFACCCNTGMPHLGLI